MQTPSDILCPISREVFELPLLCSDGFSYEKSFITKWVNEHKLSPMLGSELATTSLLENKALFFYLTAYKGMKQRLIVSRNQPKETVAEEEKSSPELKAKLKEIVNHYYNSTLELGECSKRMEEIYKALPYNSEVIINYANILRFSGEFDKALAAIKRLKKLRPGSLVPHYMRVRVLSEGGSRAKASKLLAKIQNTRRMEDHRLLDIRFSSYAQSSLGNRDTAYKVVMTYLALVKGDVRAVSHCIYLNLLLENFKYVTRTAKEHLKGSEDDVSVMFHLARAYAKMGKKAKAVETYKRIASIVTDPAARSKALYESAVNRDSDAQFEEMVQDLEDSFKLSPGEDADGYLAALYADKLMFDKAELWIKEYEKRINILENHVFLGIKAQIQEYNKKYEEAIASYIRLVEIDSANRTHYNQKIEEIIRKKIEEINNSS